MSRQRVLSGNRPSGNLHLGNYLGALQNWVRMQAEYECFFMVADWHALTSDYAETGQLRHFVEQMLIDWLALGLDPEKSTIFIQSRIKQHAELALLLGMFTPLPWLERCPTYKEQITQLENKELGNYGFLGYPVLQAADILVYRAHAVPVGEDQIPHLELTREIARRVNFLHGSASDPIFPEPRPILSPTPKLLGTDGRKMSKSYGNCIYLSEPERDVTAKVKQMVTDPARVRRGDPGNPDVCSVFDYHKVLTAPDDQNMIDRECRRAGIGCTDCKLLLAKNVNALLSPMRRKRGELEKNPASVHEIVDAGCRKAQAEAEATMSVVRDKLKLVQ